MKYLILLFLISCSRQNGQNIKRVEHLDRTIDKELCIACYIEIGHAYLSCVKLEAKQCQ